MSKVNSDGLCEACVKLRPCTKCSLRRKSYFYGERKDVCKPCERNPDSPRVRRSVRSTFIEETLASTPNDVDVHELLRGLTNTISNSLEQQLTDQGCESF
jgi:hypothetical protein